MMPASSQLVSVTFPARSATRRVKVFSSVAKAMS
jgi:hypothetical protein